MRIPADQLHTDRRRMKGFIASRIPEEGCKVILADGPEGGEAWADLTPTWDDEYGWDLSWQTNEPEWIGLGEIFEHFRRQDMTARLNEQQAQQARGTVGPYKTLKAAREAGWHEQGQEEYGGDQIIVKGRVLVRNTEMAQSATEWGRRGYRVLPGQEPHCWLSGQVGSGRGKRITWAVYRKDQVVPKRKVNVKSPQAVDVLAAVWTVNRAAKRCRDAAQACYQGGAHAFAAVNKEKKEKHYRLKSQALHYLLAEGRLQAVGYHVFPGGIWGEVLNGEGYTFHRPCPPQESEAVQLDCIEAKPRDRAEPRLKDAIYTLETYLAGKPEVECFEWPPPVRSRVQRPWSDCRWDEGEDDCDDTDSEDDDDEDDF